TTKGFTHHRDPESPFSADLHARPPPLHPGAPKPSVHGGGGYDSDFSDDDNLEGTSQLGDKRWVTKPPTSADVSRQFLVRMEEARNRRHHLISMNAVSFLFRDREIPPPSARCYYYFILHIWCKICIAAFVGNCDEAAFERHKKFVSDYILYYGGKLQDFRRSTASDKTDFDVVKDNHRFLWRDEDQEDMTWEKELAKKYYDKLFKEYCIADLSRYKENKFGFRWRIENEVVSGKGQFFCGNKRCDKQEGLKSWEVNFAYVEHGEKRNALVKLKPSSPKGTEDSEGSAKEHSEDEEGPSEADHWKGPAPSVDEKS
ncbi:FRA10AC1 protein-like, partial [Scleropages formosus]